jgi:hypothetical protein
MKCSAEAGKTKAFKQITEKWKNTEENMSATPNNATYLFEKHKKSEQWWTSIFTLVLAHIGGISGVSRLPIWVYREDGNKWRYERLPEFFDFHGVKLSDIHVEAAIPNVFTELAKNEPLRINPDIIIKRDAEKPVTIIENKTHRAGIGRVVEYIQAGKELRRMGYNATTYLLISVGNERNDIWKVVLQQKEIPLLLWEDVLRLIDDIGWLRELFDDDLKPYYSNPTLSSLDW